MNSNQISLNGKIGIGLAGGANAIGLYFNLIIIMIFLTDVVGLSPAAVGFMLLITRMFDALNDPICGVLIDRTKGTGNKTKCWITYGAIVMALSMTLLYYTPEFSESGKLAWVYITYIAFCIAYTVNILGVMTLMSRVTTYTLEKVQMSSWNMAGYSLVGGFFAMAGMPMIGFIGYGNAQRGYFRFAVLGAICIIMFSIYCSRNNNEIVVEFYRRTEKKSVKRTINNLLRNKQFIIMLFIFMLLSTGSSMSASATMYYIQYNLKRMDILPLIMAMNYAGGIIACLLAGPIVKRIGKHKSLQVMLGLAVFAYIVRWLTHDVSIGLMLVMSIVFSIASSLYLLLSTPMLIDIIDYGEYLTKEREDAVIMAASTFSQKFGMGVAAATMGMILEHNGYVANSVQQSVAALTATFNCTVVIPAVLFSLALGLMFAYNLTDEKMHKFRTMLTTGGMVKHNE